jgi:hypothetical protein
MEEDIEPTSFQSEASVLQASAPRNRNVTI